MQWVLFMNRFLETTHLLHLRRPNGISLYFLILYICIRSQFDGPGGNVSNWRSLLSGIVLTPRRLNDILENIPVLPRKQAGLGKDVPVNRALWLLQFLSSSPAMHLPSLPSFSLYKHQAVADELLAGSRAAVQTEYTYLSCLREGKTATIPCKWHN